MMEFICKSCSAELTTKDVTRQTLAVPSCYTVEDKTFHAGPFEVAHQDGAVQTRPMHMPNVQRRVDH